MHKKTKNIISIIVVLIIISSGFFISSAFSRGKLSLKLPSVNNQTFSTKSSVVKKVTPQTLVAPKSLNLGDNFEVYIQAWLTTGQTKDENKRIFINAFLQDDSKYLDLCNWNDDNKDLDADQKPPSNYAVYSFFNLTSEGCATEGKWRYKFIGTDKQWETYYKYLDGFNVKIAEGFYDEKGFDQQPGVVNATEGIYGNQAGHFFAKQSGSASVYTLRITAPYHQGTQLKSGLYYIECPNIEPLPLNLYACNSAEKK